MLLDESGRTLLCHMARANPQWESLDGTQVLVIFTGAEHYISPSWYQSKEEHGKVVPTWNYTAVHVTGHSRVFEGESLYPHLRELTRENELGHGLGWDIADAPREWVEGLIKAIVGIEIAIERIEGKWKLSQNRPERDREGVIAGLDALGTPRGVAMSRAMKHRE
jgi:transcriptional regulator